MNLTSTQAMVVAIMTFVAGVTLAVVGGLISNGQLLAMGTTLIGLFAGWVGLPKPKDL